MDHNVAKGIYEAGKDYYSIELREDYSGRNMFGGLTTALIVDDEREFVAAASRYVWDMAKESALSDVYGDHENDFDDLIDALRSYKTDNLGYNIIIY